MKQHCRALFSEPSRSGRMCPKRMKRGHLGWQGLVGVRLKRTPENKLHFLPNKNKTLTFLCFQNNLLCPAQFVSPKWKQPVGQAFVILE